MTPIVVKDFKEINETCACPFCGLLVRRDGVAESRVGKGPIHYSASYLCPKCQCSFRIAYTMFVKES